VLKRLGYKPSGKLDKELHELLGLLQRYRDRIEAITGAMPPKTTWR
jgi:hypothetical protein